MRSETNIDVDFAAGVHPLKLLKSLLSPHLRRILLLVFPRGIGEVSDEILMIHLDVPGGSEDGHVELAEIYKDIVLLPQNVEDGNGGGEALERLRSRQILEPSVLFRLVFTKELPKVVFAHLRAGRRERKS